MEFDVPPDRLNHNESPSFTRLYCATAFGVRTAKLLPTCAFGIKNPLGRYVV